MRTDILLMNMLGIAQTRTVMENINLNRTMSSIGTDFTSEPVQDGKNFSW